MTWTIRDLEARLGISKDRLIGFIRRGDLHVERIGRCRVVPEAEAEAFIRFIEGVRDQAPAPDRRRGAVCPDALGGRCVCRCHRIRKGRAKLGTSARWNDWLPQHDALLRSLVQSGITPQVIAERLSERFSVPRTRHGVKLRMQKLGLSARDGWVSGEELIVGLGSYRRRVQQWEAAGLLTRSDYGHWQRYPLTEVELLVRAQAGLTIDPRRVRDPRWKALAETSAIANRRRMTG